MPVQSTGFSLIKDQPAQSENKQVSKKTTDGGYLSQKKIGELQYNINDSKAMNDTINLEAY